MFVDMFTIILTMRLDISFIPSMANTTIVDEIATVHTCFSKYFLYTIIVDILKDSTKDRAKVIAHLLLVGGVV